jgi:hypothetical protein
LAFAQGLHETVHELLSGQIKDAQVGAADVQLMRDGVHQVRLAKADAAVQEQRVEGHRAALGHTAGGGMGKLIRFADDKAVKGEAGIQGRAGQVFDGNRTGAGGLGRGLHRGGGGCYCGRAEGKLHPLHRGASTGKLGADMVGIVALNPVAKEDRRHFKAGNAVVQEGEFQRFDPGDVIVFPNTLDQLFPDLTPSFVRHSL